ncbi:MAG: acyl transferase [Chitinophagaceae bacterium]|nr:acyl transferase [Chitinophagaceae bacterium]MCW5904632.1 acyl transferase [Chitinophagaceae bacterium]
MNIETIAKIFEINHQDAFEKEAMAVFRYQYQHNEVYKQWCNLIGTDIKNIHHSTQIPFLPISFFKTHTVTSGSFTPAIVFESSKTTGMQSSQHFVKDIAVYEQSFMKAFEMFYGNIANWCVLGLLPSYLERSNASLVYMVQKLIEQSNHAESGFYLNEFDKLYHTLQQLEAKQQPTLLIGVTFALLDFAQLYNMPLKHTTIMETGGMKGRREELTRQEVHTLLQQSFHSNNIHSEYGMTELLSQAYAKKNGQFICPTWMKVFVRKEDDPLQIQPFGKGILNIIDLANIHSCSFIATDDVGTIYEDSSFEVHGRIDNSDIRGCSLMVV